LIYFNYLVDTLRDNRGWLTDQIIAFYFLYLEHEKYSSVAHRLLFVSPQITQWLKLGSVEEARNFLITLNAASKEFHIFAVNNDKTGRLDGSHWSLLVYSRPSNTFYNFDSMNDFNRDATLQLFENLKIVYGTPTAVFVQHSNHQQLNNYDCGIHVVCNTENVIRQVLCDGNLMEVGQIFECHVSHMRQEILALIEYLIGLRSR
jgi:sentrin-specific protease 8